MDHFSLLLVIRVKTLIDIRQDNLIRQDYLPDERFHDAKLSNSSKKATRPICVYENASEVTKDR